MYKRILIPFDGSSTSLLGLKEAIRLAKDQNARLRILNVVEEYKVMQSAGIDAGVYTGEIIDMIIADGEELIGKALALARSENVEVEGASITSFAARSAECIVDDAKSWNADLIVMGTHGRRGIRRALLGSDAELVLRTAPVPVLLVRAQDPGAASTRPPATRNPVSVSAA